MSKVGHSALPSRHTPTGFVTLLFTDIEGSTRRWETHDRAMRGALRRHDAIVRAAIGEHNGHVFKTVGDAFCAVFGAPGDAAAAAIATQRTLAREDFSDVDELRIRIALHSGATHERDGDYFGPAVNRVSRLLAIAHGGQILVSRAASNLLEGALPESATLVDLGMHRLKDITAPEHVFGLIAAGLAADFPPLRSIAIASDNLPLQSTSFVGREREVAEVGSMLARYRLVTLLGPGGIGKSRTAIEVCKKLVPNYQDGVWFVELARLTDGALIPGAIAAATGVPLPVGGDAVAALVAGLASKRLMLVLDNSEHIVDATATIVSELLRDCPGVTILASSRQPLNVDGEAMYRLSPLGLPPKERAPGIPAADARRFESVALFTERAVAANSRFVLNDENAAAVVDVCERLDGIPLAIELAAARMRMLSPQRLDAMLDERFRVLTGGSRTVLPRQQTLRATIAWSYELLDERERAVFRRAGVFVDPFTLDAVRSVCSDEVLALDEFEAFDIVTSLIDKSLIVADPTDEAGRFALLDSTRAYAIEVLHDRGEYDATAARHLRFFRELAEGAEAAFESTGRDAEYMTPLRPVLGDIRAALKWSLASDDLLDGASLLTAVGRPWVRLGLTTEGISWLDHFIRALDGTAGSLIMAKLWTTLAWLTSSMNKSIQAYEAGTRAIALAREANDPSAIAAALSQYAVAAACLRRFDEAVASLDEAETLWGKSLTPGQRLSVLERRGLAALLAGDLDGAADAFETQRRFLRIANDEYGEANATIGLAETEHARGNTGRAVELAQQILPNAARLLGREQHANLLANLAGYLVARDEWSTARAVAREAIETLLAADPTSVYVANALEHVALSLVLTGAHEAAALLLGYCDAAVIGAGYDREYTESLTHQRLVASLERAYADSSILKVLVDRGSALTPQTAIATAFVGVF